MGFSMIEPQILPDAFSRTADPVLAGLYARHLLTQALLRLTPQELQWIHRWAVHGRSYECQGALVAAGNTALACHGLAAPVCGAAPSVTQCAAAKTDAADLQGRDSLDRSGEPGLCKESTRDE